jgi:hypothetical protein
VEATYKLIATMQSTAAPNTGLLPDFVINANTATPMPAPASYDEGVTDGEYGYNACRVPWRLTTDYIVSGDMRAKTAVNLVNKWIIAKTNGMPASIIDGYKLTGDTGSQMGPAFNSAFASPFGAAAMVSGNQAWLDGLWNGMTLDGTDYYGDSITLLSMLVMSGNWWPPC